MWPLAVEAGAPVSHWTGWLWKLATRIAEVLGLHEADDIAQVEALLYGWVFVIPVVAILCWAGTRRMGRAPGLLQNLIEWTVETLDRFMRSLVGDELGRRFVPYLGALFIYIFFLNVWGVIPGMQAATSTANTTVALALCTFLTTQYAGVRYGGREYARHFAGKPAWLAPLMVPLHVIGELARPVSLSMRLFGNIGGEERAVAIFVWLALFSGTFIPFQLPLSALVLFTSFVQALIFALLSAVYISGALPHPAHGHHHGGAGGDHGQRGENVP